MRASSTVLTSIAALLRQSYHTRQVDPDSSCLLDEDDIARALEVLAYLPDELPDPVVRDGGYDGRGITFVWSQHYPEDPDEREGSAEFELLVQAGTCGLHVSDYMSSVYLSRCSGNESLDDLDPFVRRVLQFPGRNPPPDDGEYGGGARSLVDNLPEPHPRRA